MLRIVIDAGEHAAAVGWSGSAPAPSRPCRGGTAVRAGEDDARTVPTGA
jgi:hypothetical protein